jgi:hypothetical protein
MELLAAMLQEDSHFWEHARKVEIEEHYYDDPEAESNLQYVQHPVYIAYNNSPAPLRMADAVFPQRHLHGVKVAVGFVELIDTFANEKGYHVLLQRVSQTEKPIGWMFIRYNLWFACSVRAAASAVNANVVPWG